MAKKRAVKRKAAKTKRKAKKTKRKATKTKRKAKKPFGGYSISFKNRNESLELVFGKPNITPSEMTKKLWKFIKKKRLGHK
jgi:chromatin remodeling complex protein RSC6